jgi:hypothetical protein
MIHSCVASSFAANNARIKSLHIVLGALGRYGACHQSMCGYLWGIMKLIVTGLYLGHTS